MVTLLDSDSFMLYLDNMDIVEVTPLDGFRLFLKFNDGVSGTVDLSSYAGKGVFSSWLQDSCFNQVRITESGALEWPGELDLCPDSLYMRLTGKSPEDLFPAVSRNLVHA